MTSHELREKISRALWETNGLSAFIDAAIAVVLEEAARVADRNAAEAWAEGAEETRGLMRMQAADIAAAIRAMIK